MEKKPHELKKCLFLLSSIVFKHSVFSLPKLIIPASSLCQPPYISASLNSYNMGLSHKVYIVQ